ncbi:MAG: hypothetical protein R3D29_05780 [Nitratireductor sp.]
MIDPRVSSGELPYVSIALGEMELDYETARDRYFHDRDHCLKQQ